MISPATTPAILTVENLRKNYGAKEAVADVSFTVGRGEIVGLLGPNGAGKTTTINMILGILKPTAGRITIAGMDLDTRRAQALQQTNFAAVYAPLPGNMTVIQNLKIFGMIYRVPELRRRVEDLLIEFDLKKFRDTKCGALSSGEQTRVCLAKALLNHPQLLLLDEPTSSLDPATAQDIRRKIRAVVSQGVGVLWTSHNMYEVTEVCDRVLFLSGGKILLQGNPKTLPAEHGHASLEDLFIAVAREPLKVE